MSISTDLRGIAEELNSMAVHEVKITPEEAFKLSRCLADLAGELDDMIVNHPRMLNGPGLTLVVDNSPPMFPRFAGVLKATNPSSTDTRPSGPDVA
jgi:hypothetical protein